MTANLKLYAFFSILWSLLFFAALNWGIADTESRWPAIWTASVVYGIGFSVVGKWLGERDSTKSRINLRGIYMLVSFSISGVIGGFWLALFHPGELWHLLIYTAIATVVVGSIFYRYRNSVKGMKNEELFK